jgi:hypothetical protein
MKLSEFKDQLHKVQDLNITGPDGTAVPAHFHITEAGLVTKHFIDCGGTIRTDKNICFQVWVANDTEHRLKPQKLLSIIAIAEKLFEQEDLEVQIEYQTDTIGIYGLDRDEEKFMLVPKHTDCLAKELCGIPAEKQKLKLSELPTTQSSCCTPGGGCC